MDDLISRREAVDAIIHDGTVIGIKDCCPLVEIRGMAQGHEFDYQYCVYAERRTDDR